MTGRQQIALDYIAGGDSPERAAERLGITIAEVDAAIAEDVERRALVCRHGNLRDCACRIAICGVKSSPDEIAEARRRSSGPLRFR